MSNKFIDISHRWPYLKAAEAVIEELEIRGFATNDSSQTTNLQEVIADILLRSVEGNTNWTIAEYPIQPDDEWRL